MARRILSEDAFLDAALELFRTYGFEGVSLKRLADATGLEKASIYYRYPGGKDEIAMAVGQRVVEWLQKNVFEPLASNDPPRRRVEIAAENLSALYSGGTKSCVTEMLSIPGGSNELRAALQTAMQAWIAAFAGIALECGLPPEAARARAEEALVGIEGSLVVSRVLDDRATFERVINSLPDLLTRP